MSSEHDAAVKELERRAVRRWRFAMFGVLPAMILIALVTGAVLSGRHSHRSRQHHHASWPAIALILLILLILLVPVGLLYRRMWRGQGIFAPPLAGGLSWSQRRAVGKAVRRGVPSSDPLQAEAERRMSRQLVRYRWQYAAIWLAMIVLGGLQALLGHPAWRHWAFGIACAVFVIVGLLQVRVYGQARRYLALSDAASAAPHGSATNNGATTDSTDHR